MKSKKKWRNALGLGPSNSEVADAIQETMSSFQIMLDGRMREATDSRTEFMKSTIAMRLQMRKEFMEILQAAGIEVPQGILEKYREQ